MTSTDTDANTCTHPQNHQTDTHTHTHPPIHTDTTQKHTNRLDLHIRADTEHQREGGSAAPERDVVVAAGMRRIKSRWRSRHC